MTNKTNPTVISGVEDLFKSFCDEKGDILIDEICHPDLVQDLNKYKTTQSKFKLVKSDLTCPFCGSKLYVHDVDEFMLNNSISMLKTVYKCSNDDCGCYVRPNWEEYISPNCNYTKSVMDIGLELSLIENISYQKQSEIIKLFTGIDITRNRLYEYTKNNFEDFVSKHNNIIEKAIKDQKIEFSNVVCYDEQYVLENNEWVYKMMALDPRTKYIYSFKVVRKKDFNLKTVVKFLKPIVEEHNIKVMSCDGAKINAKAAEELNLELDLCYFHEMANFIKLIRGPMRGLNQKIKTEEKNINENIEKIDEIKELRKGQIGNIKKEDKKAKKLVKDKRKYSRQNSKSRSKIKEYNKELKSFTDAKDAVSQCLGSKTYAGGINRYDRIINELNKFHEKTHSRIKNMKNRLDSLLMHTKYEDAPTTNNGIELAHRHTMDGREKRKYKTIEGIEREMELKRIRWNKRCCLGWT